MSEEAEQEIVNQDELASSLENEEEFDYSKYGLGNITNIAFILWAHKVGGEELEQKVRMSQEEIEDVNMTTAPIYQKIVELLGLDPTVISALISLTVLVVPRALIILDYEKAKKQKEKQEQLQKQEHKQIEGEKQ